MCNDSLHVDSNKFSRGGFFMSRKNIDLSNLAKKWPSGWVSREKVSEFTGGALSSGRLANLDSIGEGPPGRMKVGRKIVYPVDDLVAWLEERTKRLA
jgi:hypothetical protein